MLLSVGFLFCVLVTRFIDEDTAVEYVYLPKIKIAPAVCQKVNSDNVEDVFRDNSKDYDNTLLESIHIYGVPLEAPYASSDSSPNIKDAFQHSFTHLDQHMFVVFHTSDGMIWAVDKMRDGVYVSWGKNVESVVFYFNEKPRPKQVWKISSSKSTSSLTEIVSQIKQISEYDLFRANCQDCSKQIFNKNAGDNEWSFTEYAREAFFVFMLMFLALLYMKKLAY